MDKIIEVLNSYVEKHYPNYKVSLFTAQSDLERAAFVMSMINTNDPVPAVRLSQKNEVIADANISAGFELLAICDFRSAISFFNTAILSAPANSLSYILGFGRRAECLSHIGSIEEALFSVEQALKCTGIDPEYKKELEKHMKFCMELPSASSSSAVSSCPNDSLPLVRSEFLTNVSNKVAMSTNASVGRLLQATADIRTGEVIMIDEPYARGMDPLQRFSHCWNCTKYCVYPHPCKNCSDAMFCSQNCLEEAKKYHDFECPIMDLLIYTLAVPKLYLLALHMFLIATEHGTKLNELKQKVENIDVELKNSLTYDSHDFIRIYTLTYHLKSADFYSTFTLLAGYIVSALRKCTNFFDHASSDLQVFACSLLLRFFVIVECNAESISALIEQDENEWDGGDAIFATFSLLNHSCDPNVERHVFNQSLVVRAIKPIKAGEELNIGDINFAFESFSSRKAKLAKCYIICRCKACELRWPMYPSLDSKLPESKIPMDGVVLARFTNLHSYFADTFKFEWDDDVLQLMNYVKFTPATMDRLCEFIDIWTEYFPIPHQQYTKAIEAIRLGMIRVPGFQRSFGTTEGTSAAAPLNK